MNVKFGNVDRMNRKALLLPQKILKEKQLGGDFCQYEFILMRTIVENILNYSQIMSLCSVKHTTYLFSHFVMCQPQITVYGVFFGATIRKYINKVKLKENDTRFLICIRRNSEKSGVHLHSETVNGTGLKFHKKNFNMESIFFNVFVSFVLVTIFHGADV